MQERRKQDKQAWREMVQDLNDAQVIAMRNFENFGWQLRFVRRPLFKEPIPVMFDPDTKRFAVLEKDGSLNEEHDLEIRD